MQKELLFDAGQNHPYFIALYWVGQKVLSGFLIASCRKLKQTFWLTQYFCLDTLFDRITKAVK